MTTATMTATLVHSRNGFGDAIYIRPFVKEAIQRFGEVWLATAWPEVFADLDVRFIPPLKTGLRSSLKNMTVSTYEPDPPTEWDREISLRHQWRDQPRMSLLSSINRESGLSLSQIVLDLPPLPKWERTHEKVAVIRPVTGRKDWPNVARNPLPEYVVTAARVLIEAGYWVISVGDIDDEMEPLAGVLPPAHERYDRGELNITDLMSLVASADLVVGGAGWIVPMCLAAPVPAIIIGGGQGGFNAPKVLVDSQIPAQHIRWITPNRFCICRRKTHRCRKTITGFEGKFRGELAN